MALNAHFLSVWDRQSIEVEVRNLSNSSLTLDNLDCFSLCFLTVYLFLYHIKSVEEKPLLYIFVQPLFCLQSAGNLKYASF